MVRVVIVNGRPENGKTTFENICKELKGGKAAIVSTVDYVKEVAKYCGWDGTKTPRDRRFLSDLKDALTIWKNIPFKKVSQTIETAHNLYGNGTIVFVDSREPEEIELFKKTFNATTVLIQRSSVKTEITNHSDENVFDYQYDYTILNNGTLDDLKESCQTFLELLEGASENCYFEKEL